MSLTSLRNSLRRAELSPRDAADLKTKRRLVGEPIRKSKRHLMALRPSVDFGDVHLLGNGTPEVLRVAHACGQDDWVALYLLVRDFTEQVMDAVQSCLLLVHRVDDPPRRLGNVVRSNIASFAFV